MTEERMRGPLTPQDEALIQSHIKASQAVFRECQNAIRRGKSPDSILGVGGNTTRERTVSTVIRKFLFW